MIAATQDQLSEYFSDKLFESAWADKPSFPSIVSARQSAEALMGEPVRSGTPLAKKVDEAIEVGVVRAARRLIDEASTVREAYSRLVKLYEQQPALRTRTSTSVLQQAYSTPIPISYLVTVLAKIDENDSVYEPTAGNGSLLIGTNPKRATVNELNSARAAALRAQGFSATERDATTYVPEALHDVVIVNPPFGRIRDRAGGTKSFSTGNYQTAQIDHAIALNALKAMKPDGRAAIILGGKREEDEIQRSKRYNSRSSRAFYYTLYNHYNVTDHFTLSGDLYRKQGAGFPIDIIVIQGKGKSQRPLPACQVPRLYKSFDELGELLNELLLSQSQPVDAGRRRPTARRVSAGRPNRDRKPEDVSHLSRTASGLADRAVDGSHRSHAVGGRTDARPNSQSVSSRSINSHDRRRRNRRDPTASRMAASLGGSDRLSQQHHSREVGAARYRLSHNRNHQRTGEGVAIMDVRQRGDARTQSGGVVEQSDRSSAAGEDVAVATRQADYIPHSQGRSVGSLVPVNMQTAINQALERLEREVGAVDEYVAERLQYGSVEKLHQSFSAEQVDALALAIANLERGSGFILGDQTGIGKGRVVAGIIRYAKLSGQTPIFVTKDPALYADMIRDLNDIDLPGFNPFVTNQTLKSIPLPDGRLLKTSPKSHKEAMQVMQQSGSLGSYDGIFTTYSQMQTVKGKETPRREFLRQFAPGSIVILDESHEAGGDSSQRQKASIAPNRADFARELTERAAGVLYSSATYAKRPDVMDLYHRTHMRLALPNMKDLSELVQRGGIPLQQTLATTLTQDGQYTRRERSFEGTSFSSEVVPVDKDSAEKIAQIMRRIADFDRYKQQGVKALDKTLKAEAKAVLGDRAVGQAGVSSTNFTSVMHNLVSQMLLSLKAEATAQKAIEALQKNEKPVIALANTMGSFLGEYAERQGLEPGDVIEADFSDLLRRYLERSREIIVGHPYGDKERRRLSDEELGEMGVAEYNAILQLIDGADFQDIPICPIDYITHRLTKAGYEVREITGREHTVEYDPEGTARYQRRSGSERSKTAAVQSVEDFNSGRADAIILNRSGSTGISLHASEKFADRRRRHMLVAQPELDINLFMQTLGRVHRTGQVVPPAFSLLVADIPAEKRPSAVLAQKMASLNANTTAARNSGASLAEIPDFFNEYGNGVVADLMAAYPTVHEQLGSPLKTAPKGLEPEGAVRKVTGRLPLLPLAEQEQIYDLIEREYRERVAQQTALGESILEAQSLDLDARPIAKMMVEPADPGSSSPFTGAIYLEVVDAKTQHKPYTTLEAVNKVRQNLDLAPLKRLPKDYDFAKLQSLGQERTQALMISLDGQMERYKDHLQAQTTAPTAQRERAIRNLDAQLPVIKQTLAEFPVGSTVRLRTGRGDRTLFGAVSRVWRLGNEKGNPAAPSAWKIQFLLADGAREITVPLSQLNTDSENSILAAPFPEVELTYRLFNKHRGRAREERQIFTGNLLRAFERFPNSQAINYTDGEGKIRTGLLTPKDFDIQQALELQPVRMRSVEEAATVLRHGGQLQTEDRLLTLQPRKGGEEYALQTPKAKALGGQYFLDSALLNATRRDFVSVGQRMECTISGERLEDVLQAIADNQWKLAAFENPMQVRTQLGIPLPPMEKVVQQASLEQLRDWYRAARDLDLGQERLDRIRQLGFDAKKLGKDKALSISADSLAAMEQDLQRYQQFQERGQAVADAAAAVLKLTGHPVNDGTRHLKGKTYEMIQTPNSLTILKAEAGKPTKILELKEGKLERTQVTADDCQRFLQGLEQLKAREVKRVKQEQR